MSAPAHPTGEVGDIVEALRLHAFDDCDHRHMPTHLCNIAADLIQSLQSRLSISEGNVERLREALEDCVAVLADPIVGTIYGDDLDWYARLDKAVAKARSTLASLGGVG